MTIFIIAEDGTKLMPTHNVKKVRKLLRTGRAVICNLILKQLNIAKIAEASRRGDIIGS